MILRPSKTQPVGYHFKEIIYRSAWHTHLCFVAILIYYTRIEETSWWIFRVHLIWNNKNTNFGDLFLHFLSQIYQFKFKLLNKPTTDFEKEKCGTCRKKPKAEKQIWKESNKNIKGNTKIRHVSTAHYIRIDSITYFHHRYNPKKQLNLNTMGLQWWWKIQPTLILDQIIGC